mmetsp:Transcript_100774/g.300586  ORF Transcript_100774/g.300586 Transcript_100774/m.300586 type:complete len:233 (-) Transcript_100774:89-787(-)
MLRICKDSRNVSLSSREGMSKRMFDPRAVEAPYTIVRSRSASSGASAATTGSPTLSFPSFSRCMTSTTEATEHCAVAVAPPSLGTTVSHARAASTKYFAGTLATSPEGLSTSNSQGQPRTALRTNSVTMSWRFSFCSLAPANGEASPTDSLAEATGVPGGHGVPAPDLGAFRDTGVSALVPAAAWFIGWPRRSAGPAVASTRGAGAVLASSCTTSECLMTASSVGENSMTPV